MECNTIHGGHGQEARRERSRFTLQFEVNHEGSQRLLYLGANCFSEGFASPKDYLQAESKTEWMVELVFTKRTQASVYNSVTVGFARNFTVTFIYVQFLINVRNSFRFRSSSMSQVI